ncbi:tetratricopeptide repeat protein [Oceanobacillus sp. FSL H7-0719]|uniref:tetratricopeptide repeat protein n=1 Tax=Oceanobacillus sp. FSL H7-0719 TaxID=2954507 RepID=UPI00325236F2
MTPENELINKSYYQTIIDKNEKEHPIKILGEMYMEEMKGELPDLSSIRFSQGEVYFLNKDYEAAIYKWQHPLDEEFIPWAQKNIADAHVEMGLLEEAEKFYMDVQTESIALKSEVLLQLFSLYIEQDQLERSVHTIKKAVELNPDYSYVTKVAKTYFEDINDWENAVELAVNEAIRTESVSWFEILEGYAEKGLTSKNEPSYFAGVLAVLLHIDMHRFERLTEVLWSSYKHGDFYIPWLEVMNQLLLNQKVEQSYKWEKVPDLFKETYFDLISGRFLIQDISNLIEDHLTNWLALSSASDSLISSTSILSWNEVFPATLDASLVSRAEHHFVESNANQNGRQEGIELIDSIRSWAEKEGLLERLNENLRPLMAGINIEVASPAEIRNFIKAMIECLLEQRVESENEIMKEIDWNKELLTELYEMQQQSGDMEIEKVSIMANALDSLKSNLYEKVKNNLPRLLRHCSELVKEDSDFTKLHTVLNEEMNKRITHYMEKNVLYEFNHTILEWIEACEREFQDCQNLFNEYSERINQQYNQEKVVLQGDFGVLNDWKRDMERISRGLLNHEEVNIMLRNNASQLLLKGAGKLLGSMKNKEMIHNRYKNYIENKDYSEVIEKIMQPFILQLELFEKSIEWDTNRFFSESMEEIHRLMEEVQIDIEKHNNSINMMQDNPEIFRDPLTLFELKLRQYELMNTVEVLN